MPRQQKLKVFRTPIGFHDAYVAAPSRKAALEAWGSDSDLFARGIAEPVTDPELAREFLEHPGKVIRRLRGTEAEQIAALPRRSPSKHPTAPSNRKAAEIEAPKLKATRSVKPRPRPDRTALSQAERQLADAEARHQKEIRALAEREAKLLHERRELERQHDRERDKLQRELATTKRAFEKALRKWQG
jgi:hypothetical protein